MSEEFVVYGAVGCGSAAVEAALTLIAAPFRIEEVPFKALAGGANPMAQVPSLRLPGGELMTESAAILIWLADTYPASQLAPALHSPARPAFLRWMAFVSSAIYSLYWLKDDPSRVAADSESQAFLKARLSDRIAACWGIMEAQIHPGRYLLGDNLSVLDLYVTVVGRWTPREPLHQTVAPRIGEIIRRVESDPRLSALWAERFPRRPGDDQ
jgi:GST-like protein